MADIVRFLSRWFVPGSYAASFSVSESDLVDGLAEQSVAIVGNARALSEAGFGAEIDNADIVIRINRAPMPTADSHGHRTDWLALATSLSRGEIDRIKPAKILWMSPKRKRLRNWMVQSSGFYLHPLSQYERLLQTLGSPPTTGLMVIDLVARSRARKVNIYGFDFFASQSLTGRRTAAQVPHDFAAESAWVEKLTGQDDRIELIG